MSMMRASGAMLSMTALQMATASLAVPKSVVNTMRGRVPDLPGAAGSPCEGDFEQAALVRASTNRDRQSKRMRESINAPLRLGEFLSSQCQLRVLHSGRGVLEEMAGGWKCRA